jgi:hypothetical protein
MPWFAIYEKATGRLVSTGTVVADPLDPGLEKVALAAAPEFGAQDWDPAAKALVAKAPATTRIEMLVGDASVAAMLAKLTPAERIALRQKLDDLFGGLT